MSAGSRLVIPSCKHDEDVETQAWLVRQWTNVERTRTKDVVADSRHAPLRCLYIPATDRSEWADLTRQTIQLLRGILAESSRNEKVGDPI